MLREIPFERNSGYLGVVVHTDQKGHRVRGDRTTAVMERRGVFGKVHVQVLVRGIRHDVVEPFRKQRVVDHRSNLIGTAQVTHVVLQTKLLVFGTHVLLGAQQGAQHVRHRGKCPTDRCGVPDPSVPHPSK